ncbi:MAG TPA: peptidoglycan-binding domain-containing protein [Alphaproteobacteria bacterium]|nr:peptidoglycan-binding domain-containing protein [Alphaproteobacteria bacterium]
MASSDSIVELALKHLGERYHLGARAPMNNANWAGPWDCAEFVSWCVYQATGILYGTKPRENPILADAYTGYWAEQGEADGAFIGVAEAARIPGACLLRIPTSRRIGHIVLSDGLGGTIEAHSANTGVIRHTLSGRRWDVGVLVPGVQYLMNEQPIEITMPARVLRLTSPMMRGALVRAVQEALTQRGYHPGAVDGIYGPQTAAAVQGFQVDNGLVADGEAGPFTLTALGIQPN